MRYFGASLQRATSFDDLRIVYKKVCQSFSEACLALGLIEDDDEWKRAMNETVGWIILLNYLYVYYYIVNHYILKSSEKILK